MYLSERKRRESGRDYALRTLKENIIRLELAPGCMISENELARELGLSRTPVREALIELSKVGIVEIFPQRGSSISFVDYALVEEAHFLRETMEIAVLEKCCELGLTQEMREMIEENLRLQDFHLGKNHQRLLELDNEFHKMMYKAANLMNIYNLINSMTIHLDRVRTMHLLVTHNPVTIDEHHKIYGCIAKGDTEALRVIFPQHIAHYKTDKDIIMQKYPEWIK